MLTMKKLRFIIQLIKWLTVFCIIVLGGASLDAKPVILEEPQVLSCIPLTWEQALEASRMNIHNRDIIEAKRMAQIADSLYRIEKQKPLSAAQAAWAICLRDQGNLPQAITHYQLAIDYAPDTLTRINMILNIAELCFQAGDTLGIEYRLNESLDYITHLNGHEMEGYFLNMLANNFKILNHSPQELRSLYRKSIAASERFDRYETAGFACEGLVNVYLGQMKLDSCLLWLDSVFYYQQKANTPLGLSCAYLTEGNVKRAMNDFAGAYRSHLQALPYVQKAQYAPFLKDNLFQLSQLAEKNGMIKESYQYLKAYQHLVDSIEEENWKIHLSDLQFQYQYRDVHQVLEETRNRTNRSKLVAIGLSLLFTLLIVLTLKFRRRKQKNPTKPCVETNLKPDRCISAEKIELWESLELAMKDQKVFTDNELTLGSLSHQLQTNRTTLSEIINAQSGKSFNHYINEYRVAFACQLLADPAKAHLSIEGISIESGFKNRSSFYAAFNAVYGVTPSKYRKDNLLEVVQMDTNGQ